MFGIGIHTGLATAAAQVLHERLSCADHSDAAEPSQTRVSA